MARTRNIKNPFATWAPSPVLQLVSSASPFGFLLFYPKRSPRKQYFKPFCALPITTLFLLFLSMFVSFTLLGFFILSFIPIAQDPPSPFSLVSPSPSVSFSTSRMLLLASLSSAVYRRADQDEPRLETGVMIPLPVHGITGNVSEEEKEFWEQPDGEGYRPCLDFGIEYRKASAAISKEKRRFLMVVVSGGLNQQRNQIVDAVVIARILEAALVVPVLQVNLVWGDESEFSDIFDVEHFKRTLAAHVRVVSSLPSTHLMSRQSIEHHIPRDVSPLWIRTRFSKQLHEEGLLVLKGLDSKLSKNLLPDLQKLRCKVAFHAIRFVAPIQHLGNQLARRMWIEGPYIALHLRLEKDVWVRSGCLTGLTPEYDKIISDLRNSHPQYLTGKLKMNQTQRRLAGLCPLNAKEIARFLKALGVSSNTRIYIAGGEPFGKTLALQPLVAEFPNLINREMLAQEGELSPYTNRSSALAAIDYIVSLSSNVYVASHGGNMERIMQGQRAYMGHRKCIKPNKRAMLPFLDDSSISDAELGTIIRKLHSKSQGHPKPRTKDRDVIAYPVPECMCKHSKSIF